MAIKRSDIEHSVNEATSMVGFNVGYEKPKWVTRWTVHIALTAAGVSPTIEAVSLAAKAAERGRQYRIREVHAENCDCDRPEICDYCRQEGCCE